MRLFLIRHGESTWNAEERVQGWSDPPLSELGRWEAAQLPDRLRGNPINAIYASPLKRAAETAQIVADALRLELRYDERLREMHLGVLEGLTGEEIAVQYPQIHRSWVEGTERVPIPDQEDEGAFYGRVQAVMDEIAERHRRDDDTVAVVCHGGVVGAFIAHLLGVEQGRRFPYFFENASVTTVTWDEWGPTIELFNDVCHLHE